jgi:hypothetical protein
MRVTRLDDASRWTARSDEGAPVHVEPQGPDLLIKTVVSAHDIVVERE